MKVRARNKVAALEVEKPCGRSRWQWCRCCPSFIIVDQRSRVLVQALDPVIPVSVVDTSTALSKGFEDEKRLHNTIVFETLGTPLVVSQPISRRRKSQRESTADHARVPFRSRETSRGPEPLYDEDWLSSGKRLSSAMTATRAA